MLLSLGVSHTNELDSSEAVRYLRRWASLHATYGAAVAAAEPPASAAESLPALVSLLEGLVSGEGSGDADLLTALGVAHNLGRNYDGAVAAFRRALELSPHDYSLWNKLGATLANSSRSAEALEAYQRALDLKPNYMRAWTNMGISYANLADYERSARYYVRALSLNPRAGAVWSYLRTSLTCAGRPDLLASAADESLPPLQQALPL